MRININELKAQVANGDLKQALSSLVTELGETEFENETILLQTRLNRAEQEQRLGVSNPDDTRREMHQITLAVLDLLSRVEDGFFTQDVIFEPLRFFESPKEATPKNERQYADTFESAKTRYVRWELNLKYPKVAAAVKFRLKWRILKGDELHTANLHTDFSLEQGWTNSWHTDGWGSENLGNWSAGTYTVELFYKDKKVAKGSFKIV